MSGKPVSTTSVKSILRRTNLYVAVAVAAVGGCATEFDVVPVRGVLQHDGAAMPDVLVTFVPETTDELAPPVSRGISGADGSFELECDDGRAGAVVGRHRVVLEDLRPFRAPRTDRLATVPAPPSRLDGRYASAGDTPLRVDVSADNPAPTIDVPPRPNRPCVP